MSAKELEAAAPGKSVTGLFAITLACWLWPFFQWTLIEMVQAYGYALNLGGGLLNLLACAISVLLAIIFSFALYFAMRGEHSPVNPGRIFLYFLSFNAAASIVVIVFLIDMFCRVGSCPTLN